MHLADHIRPLLRDHDCVIIPDFGGLVADVSSARAQPGRQALSPPTKLVAFNQALTRNDGLLVDALSQHLGLPIAQAREAVRSAVAGLQQELDETNRTELPGIGVFRRAAGRGLAFEYTGTDNLLAAAFGLPELAARPVRTTDNRAKRPQPALRGTPTRRTRLARLVPGSIIAIAASLVLLANYQFALNAGYLPTSWRAQMPKWELPERRLASVVTVTEPQQATLGQRDFSSTLANTDGMTLLESTESAPAPNLASQPTAPSEEATPSVATKPVAAPASSVPAKPVITAPAKPAAETVQPAAIVAEAAPEPVVAKASAAAAASASSVTIKTRTNRFYVIAGAYSSLKGAEQGRKNLVHSGHNSHIILPPPGSRLFRLTAADYPDQASARQEAQRLRVSTRNDFNTLYY